MIPAILYTDFYKTDHRRQYPAGTTKVYSNLTPRISRLPGVDHVLVFGIQYFLHDFLVDRFNKTFFRAPKGAVIRSYQRRMDTSLGLGAISTEHLEALHDLGYLPLEIKALPEGSLCPLKVPVLTITNTHPEFSWLPNFLESILSNCLWHPMTSATIAYEYRKMLHGFALRTSDIPEFVLFQGHDFSMRGQTSFESTLVSGGAHLTCFQGSDSIPSIDWLENFYYANADKEMIGCSVPATEHSVMCLGGQETEPETYKRLITQVYSKGFISIVSDTWDYWHTVNHTVRSLKEEILARDGKVVIRPDSGDPVKIICGDSKETAGSPPWLGTMAILWDIFGGTINSKGYKQLDSHIGLIYGDSITLDRCYRICQTLEQMGFASTNMVFGIGSYTYQYVTRDTLGFAMKATYGVINGKPVEIFKDPLTDGGVKKSAKGLLRVDKDSDGEFVLSECVTPEQERGGELRTVFLNGLLPQMETLSSIRARISTHLESAL